MDNVKIIFFPFAGGHSNSFKDLQKAITQTGGAECLCVEYPGRGGRYKDRLLPDAEALVQDIRANYSHWFTGQFYFLGYSMGAIMARLLSDELLRTGSEMPSALFAMACRSPRHVFERTGKIGKLAEEEFLQHVIAYGGIHPSILDHPDFLAFLSPIIRSDYQAYEGARCAGLPPVGFPIHAWGGTDDDILPEELKAWKEETSSEFGLTMLPGGHFFLHDQLTELAASINRYVHIHMLSESI